MGYSRKPPREWAEPFPRPRISSRALARTVFSSSSLITPIILRYTGRQPVQKYGKTLTETRSFRSVERMPWLCQESWRLRKVFSVASLVALPSQLPSPLEAGQKTRGKESYLSYPPSVKDI